MICKLICNNSLFYIKCIFLSENTIPISEFTNRLATIMIPLQDSANETADILISTTWRANWCHLGTLQEQYLSTRIGCGTPPTLQITSCQLHGLPGGLRISLSTDGGWGGGSVCNIPLRNIVTHAHWNTQGAETVHVVFVDTIWNKKDIENYNNKQTWNQYVSGSWKSRNHTTIFQNSGIKVKTNLRVKKSGVFDSGLSQTCRSWKKTRLYPNQSAELKQQQNP